MVQLATCKPSAFVGHTEGGDGERVKEGRGSFIHNLAFVFDVNYLPMLEVKTSCQ